MLCYDLTTIQVGVREFTRKLHFKSKLKHKNIIGILCVPLLEKDGCAGEGVDHSVLFCAQLLCMCKKKHNCLLKLIFNSYNI